MSERTAVVLALVGLAVACAGLVLSPWPWLAAVLAGLALAVLALFADSGDDR